MKTAAVEVLPKISLKNILYATDFSRSSEAALAFVLGFARKYGATVHALHVRTPSAYWSMAPEVASEMVVTEQELAQRDADRLHRMLASVPHDVTIASLDIWTPLSEMISRHKIDLIVIGTHGRTGISKAVLGSVAAEIIRSVPRPVLTIGPEVRFNCEAPLEFERILFATNLGAASLDAVPYATGLAHDFESQLIVMKVVEKEGAGEFATPGFYSEFETRKMREVIPADCEQEFSPKFVVEKGDAAKRILKVARDLRADLIVLGTKDAGGSLTAATHFSRATAQRVIAGAPSPVLTVPHL